MKNLRGFKSNNGQQQSGTQQSPEELLKTYGNMSEDALFEKLMSEVAASKSNGSFSAQELASSVAKMKPYLSAAQTEKLEHLMRLITSN